MNRILSIILFGSMLCAGDAQPIPANAKPTLDKVNTAIIKAKTDYDKQVKAAEEAAIKDLTTKADALAKAGKLDDALAVKAVADSIKAKDYAETVLAESDKAAANLLGDATDPMIGKWKRSDGYVFIFNSDNSGTLSNGWAFKWHKVSDTEYKMNYTNNPSVDVKVILKGKLVYCVHETGALMGMDKVTDKSAF